MRKTATVLALAMMCWSAAAPATAQSLARFSLDSSVSADLFRGENDVDRPNIIVDVTAVARFGDRWMLYVRPWFRQPRTPVWDKQIYQAAMQYQRPGPIATRVDLGYIVSPFGLGMLDTRPSINPTIAPHFSYLLPMPAIEKTTPRVNPIASTYPLGGQFTASTNLWDARAAVVSTTPTRIYVINKDGNPKPTPALVLGAGITPTIGLRIGGSFAHGSYASDGEVTDTLGARDVTMFSVEGEYAFKYTKFSGEVTRDSFETAKDPEVAYAWFVQGVQTLTPRLFAAGRQEGVSAPPAASGILFGTRSAMYYSEATVGYRLSNDFTLRGGMMARKQFTRPDWDQQIGVSVVWAKRWW